MNYFQNAGEVTIEGTRISWIIRDFFNFTKTINTYIGSRCFYFKRKEFYFSLYPYGTTEYPEWMKLGLAASSDCHSWQVQFGISGVFGENVDISCDAQKVEFYRNSFFVDRFIRKERLIKEKVGLVLNGTLCIYAIVEVTAVPDIESGLEVPQNEKKHSLADLYTQAEKQFEEPKNEKRRSLVEACTQTEKDFEVPQNKKKHSLAEAYTQTETHFVQFFPVQLNRREDVGEVTIEGSRISWIITDFFNFPNTIDTCIVSRDFYFKNQKFFFTLLQNVSNPEWMKLVLVGYSKCDNNRMASRDVQFGISGTSGDIEISCAKRLEHWSDFFYVDLFIRKERLIEEQDRLLPNRALCISAILDLEVAAVLEAESGLEVPKDEKTHSLSEAYTQAENHFARLNRREDVGEVTIEGSRISWIIIDFFNFPNTTDTCIVSRDFHFENQKFFFTLVQNVSSPEWMKLVLVGCSKCDNNRMASWHVQFGISANSGDIEISNGERLDHWSDFFYVDLFIRKERLIEEKDRLVPNGTLCIFAILDLEVTAVLEAESGLDLKGLAHDFKDLLITGNGSDFTIKLHDMEYKVHRTVLIARSPVFFAMLADDTKQKATDVAILEDLDPEVFSDFLHYLYSGSVETLTRENMLKLYVTADRYQVMKLKNVCVDYIGSNIFVDNFCDVMTLAVQHSEKSLITLATEFFLQNYPEIVRTSKWQIFLSENTTTGNELIMNLLHGNVP